MKNKIMYPRLLDIHPRLLDMYRQLLDLTKIKNNFSPLVMDKKSGFTLIELLVVIGIIAILTAVLLPNMVGMRERASDSTIKNELTQLKTALRLYYNDYQTYPSNESNFVMMGCGNDGDSACTPGAVFSAGSVVYMPKLPANFFYEMKDAGNSFVACARLKNEGDADISKSQSACEPHSSMVGDSGHLKPTEAFCVCGM